MSTDKEYSSAVISGTKGPRKKPPIQKASLGGISLLEWVKIKGLRPTWPSAFRNGRPRFRSSESQARAVAFAIQRKIAAVGTPANPYNTRINRKRITDFLRREGRKVVDPLLEHLTRLAGIRVIGIETRTRVPQPRDVRGRFLSPRLLDQ